MKHNEHFSQIHKYDSIESIPNEFILESSKRNAMLASVFGLIVIIGMAIIQNSVEKEISGFMKALIYMGGAAALGIGLNGFLNKVKVLLTKDYIECGDTRINWKDIESPIKHSGETFVGTPALRAILVSKNNRLEFLYNHLTVHSSEAEQLIYLFWKRGKEN